MIGHSLKKIKENLHAALSGVAGVQGRVLAGEAEPGIGLPNIVYKVSSESVNDDGAYMKAGDDPYERKLLLSIEARAILRDGSEAPIDDLCEGIESAVKNHSRLNGWCQELRLTATEYETEENDLPIGLATLSYEGFYQEAQPVEVYELRYFVGKTSVIADFITTLPGKATLIARGTGPTLYYGPKETVSSIFHGPSVEGLEHDTAYEMYYLFDADPIGISIDEFDMRHPLTDGFESYNVHTT